MSTLQEAFKDCNAIKSNQKCPLCKAKLYLKRLKIDENKFKGVKKIGITHKAVNFCSNPECDFLEQGIVHVKDSYEKFFGLKEIDDLIQETIESSFKKSYSHK
ncbi:MAG: hypothetical protein ACFE8A_14925 [Candidatus Hodarchaeota archaeon]